MSKLDCSLSPSVGLSEFEGLGNCSRLIIVSPEAFAFFVGKHVSFWPGTSLLDELVVHVVHEDSVKVVLQVHCLLLGEHSVAILESLFKGLRLVDTEPKGPDIVCVSLSEVDQDHLHFHVNLCQELDQLTHLGEERRSGGRSRDDEVGFFVSQWNISECGKALSVLKLGVDKLAKRVQSWLKVKIVGVQEKDVFPELRWQFTNNLPVLSKRVIGAAESILSQSLLL